MDSHLLTAAATDQFTQEIAITLVQFWIGLFGTIGLLMLVLAIVSVSAQYVFGVGS